MLMVLLLPRCVGDSDASKILGLWTGWLLEVPEGGFKLDKTLVVHNFILRRSPPEQSLKP